MLKEISRIALMAIKIFIIILIIGMVLPLLLNMILELLPLKNTIDSPHGNSTFVMTLYYSKKNFVYYLKEILLYFFTLHG